MADKLELKLTANRVRSELNLPTGGGVPPGALQPADSTPSGTIFLPRAG